jgi:hypothetical protein
LNQSLMGYSKRLTCFWGGAQTPGHKWGSFKWPSGITSINRRKEAVTVTVHWFCSALPCMTCRRIPAISDQSYATLPPSEQSELLSKSAFAGRPMDGAAGVRTPLSAMSVRELAQAPHPRTEISRVSLPAAYQVCNWLRLKTAGNRNICAGFCT